MGEKRAKKVAPKGETSNFKLSEYNLHYIANYSLNKEIFNIRESCSKYGIKLCHTFTSPRWNFFGNPNEDMRAYWLWWFKKFALMSKNLGARSTGSLLGIYSVSEVSNLNGEVFNIGNPDEREILELANIIVEFTASQHGIEYLPARDEDPQRRCPDINKITKYTGWEPKIGLREGVEKTIKYYRDLHQLSS